MICVVFAQCTHQQKYSSKHQMSSPRDSTPLLHRPYMMPLRRRPWHKDKMFYFNLIRRGLAEFLGTGLFVFTSVSALSNVGQASKSWDYSDEAKSFSVAISAGLAQGLAYGALVAAMMNVSGGHLNPAVTAGVLVAGGVNIVAAIVYFIAQLVGGIAGAACVLAYDNGTALEYGVTQLQRHINPVQGIFIEMLLTMLLVMVFIHTTMERSEYRPVAPVVIGLALTAAIVSSYPLTGGSMNPIRSFGPAVVSKHSHRWTDHYVYWVGPLLGGTIAGLFYRVILSSKPLIPITDPDVIPRTV